MRTAFFAPFPSPVDKLVFSIFARDFHGPLCQDHDDPDAQTAVPSTTFIPTFDEVVAHTRRLCSQVLSQEIVLPPNPAPT